MPGVITPQKKEGMSLAQGLQTAQSVMSIKNSLGSTGSGQAAGEQVQAAPAPAPDMSPKQASNSPGAIDRRIKLAGDPAVTGGY